jgi:hypothetical protein
VSDETRQAYAVLGLAVGAAPREIKRRYRSLVKQWHPDRFQADPVGQADAAVQMRRINDAYRTIQGAQTNAWGFTPASSEADRARTDQQEGGAPRRLSRDEIDAMVTAIWAKRRLIPRWRTSVRAGRWHRFLVLFAVLVLVFSVLREDWTTAAFTGLLLALGEGIWRS